MGNALLARARQLVKNNTVSYAECVILPTQVCVFSKLNLTNSTVRLDTDFIAVSCARQ